ncbi:uncharacterized protein LOC128557341 [Mercenaria mercenaria]|uniref:uncharacterized protein LOC128557341 n=1 Tax=Mercenaria mercenaria TaxID=6596 RepID=UPI00234F2136|nr:uncharacterized protein LOC128557341 [Mercenaria mercenaria]
METTSVYLMKLFKAIWDQEVIPTKRNKGLIVKIPKKGDHSICDNYRGITLLSVPSKVFSRILISRIQSEVENKLREEQAGFRSGRSTTEQLFTLQKLKENASSIGLKISSRKTKVMRLNARIQTPVKIDQTNIEDVETFTYLGGIITSKGGSDEDIDSRIGKGRNQFRRLRKIWTSSIFSIQTKVKLFNSLVMSVLLYGSETWKATEQDKKKLDTFQNRCLRQIFRIRWPNKIRNEDLHKRAKTTKASETVTIRKWKWIGHILRQENTICNTALTWQPEGKRKVGRPKTTWRRTTEQERKRLGWNSWATARTAAKDRTQWKQRIKALYTNECEEDRETQEEEMNSKLILQKTGIRRDSYYQARQQLSGETITIRRDNSDISVLILRC